MAKKKELKISRAIELSRAISMPGSLMNTTGGALDVRYVAANEADRTGIPQVSRYEGLQVFQQDTKVLYVLKDNSTADGVWEAVALGGSVAEDLSKVTEKVAGLESKITDAEGKITANEKAIEGLDTKATAAKNRLDGIDTEISGIKEAATSLTGRVEGTEGRLNTVEPKVTALEDKANAVVAESAQNKSDIAALTKTVGDNKTSTDKAISDVNKKVDDNKKETDDRLTAVETKASTNEGAIASLNSKVDAAVESLGNKDSAQDEEIQKLKDAITNKNNNTVVVDTFAEIATANPNPKAGDLAYVISEKKSYIYTENAPTAKITKSGDVAGQWIEFDEISSELDLADYLKKADAEAKYRKLADKIAKSDLATELVTEIDAKAVKADVDEALTKKADKQHTHEIAEVTGLQGALDGKAAAVHEHTVANITDFAEKVDAAIVAKDYATNTTVTAVSGKVDAHVADADKHVSATQKQQLVDLGVKGAEGSLFSKVAALEAKKVEVDNKTIVRSDDDIISVKDGVFSKEGHKHTVADITDLDTHLDSKNYAGQDELDNHVGNSDIHVTKAQKEEWDAHKNNLGIHVQIGGDAPAPNTFGLWLDLNADADKKAPIVGTFKADETTCS